MLTTLGGVWRGAGREMPGSRYGMTNNIPNLGFSTVDQDDWLSQRAAMGGDTLFCRRVFDSGFPATWAASNAGDMLDTLTGIWSFKPSDVAGVVAGDYDTELGDLAATIPSGTYITSYHEPEAGQHESYLHGGKFVDYMRAVYAPMKSANPSLQIGYCAMAYRWGDQFAQDWADWYPGDDHCDFLAIDTYNMEFETLRPLREKQDFLNWWVHARLTGKQLHIWEYGHTWGGQVENHPDGRPDAPVAAVIDDDLQWAAENGIHLVMYWNTRLLDPLAPPDGLREWAISDTNFPRPLSLAAWTGGVARFGNGYYLYEPPNTATTSWSVDFALPFGDSSGTSSSSPFTDAFDINFGSG